MHSREDILDIPDETVCCVVLAVVIHGGFSHTLTSHRRRSPLRTFETRRKTSINIEFANTSVYKKNICNPPREATLVD